MLGTQIRLKYKGDPLIKSRSRYALTAFRKLLLSAPEMPEAGVFHRLPRSLREEPCSDPSTWYLLFRGSILFNDFEQGICFCQICYPAAETCPGEKCLEFFC